MMMFLMNVNLGRWIKSVGVGTADKEMVVKVMRKEVW